MDQVIIFLGPSASHSELSLPSGWTIAPPAKRGDVLKVIAQKPIAIALVDGYFGICPSVMHKEILQAISAGIRVYGAASMGALRAAELGAFGMVGVGQIYADYASGKRISDADVAVAHGPEELDYIVLSHAHVDLCATVDVLVENGEISTHQSAQIKSISNDIFFSERRFSRIAADATDDPDAEERLSKMLQSSWVSQKKLDVIALCDRIARDLPTLSGNPTGELNVPVPPSYRRIIGVLRNNVIEKILNPNHSSRN